VILISDLAHAKLYMPHVLSLFSKAGADVMCDWPTSPTPNLILDPAIIRS